MYPSIYSHYLKYKFVHSTFLNLQLFSLDDMKSAQDKDISRYMFVRNPYSRILSAYLDKVVEYHGKMKIHHPIFNSSLTFLNFLQNLQKTPTEQWNDHLTPLSSKCFLDKTNVSYTHYLKVEQIDQWYPDVIRRLRLEDAVMGWNFSQHSIVTHGCFYEVIKGNCSATAKIVSGSLKNVNASKLPTQRTADKLLGRYFGPQEAQLATQMYHRDLKEFQYPLWDGKNAMSYLLSFNNY